MTSTKKKRKHVLDGICDCPNCKIEAAQVYDLLAQLFGKLRVPPEAAMRAMSQMILQQMVYRAKDSNEYDQNVSDLLTWLLKEAKRDKEESLIASQRVNAMPDEEVRQRAARRMAEMQSHVLILRDEDILGEGQEDQEKPHTKH